MSRGIVKRIATFDVMLSLAAILWWLQGVALLDTAWKGPCLRRTLYCRFCARNAWCCFKEEGCSVNGNRAAKFLADVGQGLMLDRDCSTHTGLGSADL
jgi:hypothetical protein